jgi:hypothetical protein
VAAVLAIELKDGACVVGRDADAGACGVDGAISIVAFAQS